MGVAFGTPATVSAVLDALAARLVAATGLSADRVFESLASDAAHLQYPPADRFVTVSGFRFPAGVGAAGGGRSDTGFAGSVRVAAFSRLATDQELRHTKALRSGSKAALVLSDKIIDGLQLFQPTDPAGAQLLREPMRIESWEIVPRDHKDGSAWVVVPSVWSVKFTQFLS